MSCHPALGPMPWRRCVSRFSFDGVHNFLDTLFGDDLHAKRVEVFGRSHARGDPVRVAGGRPDRPGSGAGTRAADQARG